MSLWTRAGLSWRELVLRLYRQIFEDALLGHCAELAYYFLFSVFPLLLFLTSLLGYIARASDEVRVNLFTYIARVAPSSQITGLLSATLDEITAGRGRTSLSLGLAGAVWVSSSGMLAIGSTLNSACGYSESRIWWKRRAIAILLTVAFAVFLVLALTLMIAGGTIGEALALRVGVGPLYAFLWRLVQWPLTVVFLVLSFDLIYNFAADVGSNSRREWGTPGAVTAALLWLGASFGMRVYLHFARSYTRTYGGLGAVIILLIWFYLTGFAILMGGEVNSEISLAVAARQERSKRAKRAAQAGGKASTKGRAKARPR